MEIHNTLKSQNNLEKEEQEVTGPGSLTSEYTTSYSNQRKQDYTMEKRPPPQYLHHFEANHSLIIHSFVLCLFFTTVIWEAGLFQCIESTPVLFLWHPSVPLL